MPGLYKKFITDRRTLDLVKIRDFINEEDCLICIDNVHGSTRGYIEGLSASAIKSNI
jgi:hypothetical protein